MIALDGASAFIISFPEVYFVHTVVVIGEYRAGIYSDWQAFRNYKIYADMKTCLNGGSSLDACSVVASYQNANFDRVGMEVKVLKFVDTVALAGTTGSLQPRAIMVFATQKDCRNESFTWTFSINFGSKVTSLSTTQVF